jgi:S-adenosylmethionine synthetase
MIMVFGEITTKAVIDFQKVVRSAVASVGYTNPEWGIGDKTLSLLVAIEQQSPEIGAAVHGGDTKVEDLGAGDQGLMFGYATNETPSLMPASYEYARQLALQLRESRNSKQIPWLRPDAKTQVTVEYEKNGTDIAPKRVHSVLISTQHDPDVTNETIRTTLIKLVKDTLPKNMIDDNTVFHINPSGSFVVGGPQGDAGLTGRKIIVDTYGGWGAHGGGAFSGKDPSKVDRSAAYAARWVAKSIVAAGLAKRALVQVAYSIGIAEPLSIYVDTYGTGTKSDEEILEIVKKNFSLTPYHIIKELNLRRPIYAKTAQMGHFGREDPDFTWEKPKALKF